MAPVALAWALLHNKEKWMYHHPLGWLYFHDIFQMVSGYGMIWPGLGFGQEDFFPWLFKSGTESWIYHKLDDGEVKVFDQTEKSWKLRKMIRLPKACLFIFTILLVGFSNVKLYSQDSEYPNNLDLSIRFETDIPSTVKINGIFGVSAQVYLEANSSTIPGEWVEAKIELTDPDGIILDSYVQVWDGFDSATDGWLEEDLAGVQTWFYFSCLGHKRISGGRTSSGKYRFMSMPPPWRRT